MPTPTHTYARTIIPMPIPTIPMPIPIIPMYIPTIPTDATNHPHAYTTPHGGIGLPYSYKNWG